MVRLTGLIERGVLCEEWGCGFDAAVSGLNGIRLDEDGMPQAEIASQSLAESAGTVKREGESNPSKTRSFFEIKANPAGDLRRLCIPFETVLRSCSKVVRVRMNFC